MYPYLFIFFLSIFFLKIVKDIRLNNFFFIFLGTSFLPTLLAGLRSDMVGTDTITYLLMYENILAADSFVDALLLGNIELLYIFLTYTIDYLGGSFPYLLSTYQCLTFLFVFIVAYRYKKYISIYFVVFFYFVFIYNMSLNITRQCLAISYVLYITTYLIQDRKRLFLILSLFSFFVHASAVFACCIIYIIYILAKLKGKKQRYMTFLFLCAIISVFFSFNIVVSFFASLGISRFQSYTAYMEGGVFDSGVSITDVFFRCVFLFIAIGSSYKHIIPNNLSFCYILLIIVEIILLCLGVYSKFLYRMALYLTVYHLFFLPLIATSPRFSLGSRRIMSSGVFLLGCMYWFWLIVYRNSNSTIPYSFFN